MKIIILAALLVPCLSFADAPVSAPTDSEIIKTLATINTGEINSSQLAEKSSNRDIKAMAKKMVKAHSKSNVELEKLARSLSLKQEDSRTSDELKTSSETEVAKLKTLKGAEFNKAYVDDLVAGHQTALKTLDDSLIPSAKDSHLKTLLSDTREVVQAHLDHAKKLQAALNK